MRSVSVILTALATASQLNLASGKLVTVTMTTTWRPDSFPTPFTTTRYITLVRGGGDTTVAHGVTITKTIHCNVTYASNASDLSSFGYITTLASSLDTAVVAFESSTVNAEYKSAAE